MTAYDLKPKFYAKPITARGYLSQRTMRDSMYWNINESSILTELIQQTGRYAERYASDLFIDWSNVDKFIKDGTQENHTWFFGIREDGVDHESFITCRMNDGPYWKYKYRKIFRLDAKLGINDDTQLDLTLVEVE